MFALNKCLFNDFQLINLKNFLACLRKLFFIKTFLKGMNILLVIPYLKYISEENYHCSILLVNNFKSIIN